MSSLSCLELQQSARTNRVGRSAAGCWQLAPGRALSLRLQTPGALRVARGRAWLTLLLIRPCEVLSRVANVTILEVANNALRVLLQHRHVIIGSLA